MPDHPFAMHLRSQIGFFTRGTASLTEVDSAFTPQAEMMSVAAHAAHVASTVAPGPIMGGVPRLAMVSGLGDHTAHHRGVLAVYARLCDRVPVMPNA